MGGVRRIYRAPSPPAELLYRAKRGNIQVCAHPLSRRHPSPETSISAVEGVHTFLTTTTTPATTAPPSLYSNVSSCYFTFHTQTILVRFFFNAETSEYEGIKEKLTVSFA